MTSVTPATLPERVKLPPHLYRVALLLGLSIFIYYFDLGTLSLAAPFIKSDQGLSDYQLGIVLSAFFWTYAGFQMISGWLVDRLDVNWVLFCGVALWCAATGASRCANWCSGSERNQTAALEARAAETARRYAYGSSCKQGMRIVRSGAIPMQYSVDQNK